MCFFGEPRGKYSSRLIERDLRRNAARDARAIKLLLLGAGESGKSTIVKQMQMIHGIRYSDAEMLLYRNVVHSNLLGWMRELLSTMLNMHIPLQNPGNEAHAALLLTNDIHLATIPMSSRPDSCHSSPLNQALVTALTSLWRDPALRRTIDLSRDFYYQDSPMYFFDSIDRIVAPDYWPTMQDILRTRVKSPGVVEVSFQIDKLKYRLVDVGGQRCERRKWIHCFDRVNALIFMVAVSEFDQVLFEDTRTNRMIESLNLFEWVCGLDCFQNTAIILFLNKIDLFKEKLARTRVAQFFPEYRGQNNVEEACRFFLQKFVDIGKSETRPIYAHLTCATDTDKIKFVMKAVNSRALEWSLMQNGMI